MAVSGCKWNTISTINWSEYHAQSSSINTYTATTGMGWVLCPNLPPMHSNNVQGSYCCVLVVYDFVHIIHGYFTEMATQGVQMKF